MAYAISICAVVAFLALYLITRRPVKPRYVKGLGDEEFRVHTEELVRSIPVPEKTSKIAATGHISRIKWDMFWLGRKRYAGEFDDLLIPKDKLKQLSSLPLISSLPSAGGEPRAVKLARFCFESCAYLPSAERVRFVLESQNAWRTLTFKEIEGMKQAFKYVALEALASAYEKLRAVAKGYDVAYQYVSSPATVPQKYANMPKSKLFLSLCAKAANYKAEFYCKIYQNCIDKIRQEVQNITAFADEIEKTDFTRFYSPLEIYDKYEIFSSADAETKRNFLRLAGKISDSENIDEFLFAIRLDKYMHSASSGHMALKRFSLGGSNVSVVRQKRDITMLGTALSSHYFMDIYFRPIGKRFLNKSITKILEYENSFEPIYKFRTVNLGISTKDGKLRLSPALPDGVRSADIVFEHMGVEHSLHLKRGDERALYLGSTKINGVSGVALGDRPLDITLILPEDED